MKISGGMLIGLTKGLANYLLELRILFDFVIEKFLFVSKTLFGINFYDNFERDISRMVLKNHSGPENLKKSRPKKLVKSNKSTSQMFFWTNSIFCNFKNGQKSIFELGKSLKLPKMQFHIKKKRRRFIWFHEFFCLDSFKFSDFLIYRQFNLTKFLYYFSISRA